MTLELPISELITTLIDYRGKTPTKTTSGVPLITAKIIKNGRILRKPREYIAEDAYDLWMRRGLPATGDILVTTEAPLGEVAQVPEDARVALAQRVILLRADPLKVDPQFLFHFLRSPLARERLEQRSSGTTVSGIRQPELRAMLVPLLERRSQETVGQILDSLDNLIENNRRRVAVLEELARAIYVEWFVRFRYPGYGTTALVDSSLGSIPDGWKVKSLAELAEVDKGLSYKGQYLTDHGVPMANLKCFRPEGGFRREGTKPYSGPYKASHQVSPGELIMANTDLTQAGIVIGSPAFVPRQGFAVGGIITHHLFAIRPRWKNASQWLYESFCDVRFRSYARGVASGATVLGFRPADLLAYPLVFPPQKLVDDFSALRGDLARLAENLNDTTDRLIEVRGQLLPKLVTGEIDVSSLDLDAILQGAAA